MSSSPCTAPDDRWSLRVARSAVRLRSDVPLACLDALLVALAYGVVLVGRFEAAVPRDFLDQFLGFLPLALLVHLAANWAWGLYGQMWRHASVQEARRILLAGGSATVLLTTLVLQGPRREVPLSVLLLGGLLASIFVGGLRFQSRLFAFRRHGDRGNATRLVVIGAGDAGAAIIRELQRDPASGLVPVALLDDDPRTHGRRLNGVPVIGGLGQLQEAATECGAEQALLAIPSADGQLVRAVANAADAAGLPVKVLPRPRELVDGEVSVRDVRDLQIDDLLGRQQVATDLDAVRAILAGRRVLITGAGGSIGAEIARQVADCDPSALLLLDHDETHLHDAAASISRPCTQLLADIRDRQLIVSLFERFQPQVVFHAAAHKHVPLLEAHPCEAVATNVLGTANVLAAARGAQVERFVFISTDKAVRPASVMGATKRLGEQLVLTTAPHDGRYCAVRFGNVLGSRGSVIPTFMRQIEAGGPVTVTHADMTRYFMSISEAVQLVLQAAAFSNGGEVFMLEMGEPVRIMDLAERMIRLSGRCVGTDVAVRITGMRPGERLEEELRAPEEAPSPTPHPSIVALQPHTFDAGRLRATVRAFAADVRQGRDGRVRDELFRIAHQTPEVVHLPDDDLVSVRLDEDVEEELAWSRSIT